MGTELKFAAIIPSRGTERRILVDWQMNRAAALGYDHVYVINHKPENEQVDIYARIAKGVELARADGVDYCSIIEDDDFYSLNYLDVIKARLTPGVELFGINQTMYFHLFSTGVKRMSHPGRSSLFCTTFKLSAFDKLPQVGAEPFVDLAWWSYANKTDMPRQLINDDLAIGIKHGSVFGRVGGHGHFIAYASYDYKLLLLKRRMDEEAFKFFYDVKQYYQKSWQQGLKA